MLIAIRALGNTLPVITMAIIHVLRDERILHRLRYEILTNNYGTPFVDVGTKDWSRYCLLSSVYAETLRLHMTACVPIIPLHSDLSLGKWKIPKGSYGFINTGILHKNPEVWNTKNGVHSVDSFWAERFIVDPSDPSSGPICPGSSKECGMHNSQDAKPRFTTEGLDGSWLPYGGMSSSPLLTRHPQ